MTIRQGFLCFAIASLRLGAQTAPQTSLSPRNDGARPVIIFVHGREQEFTVPRMREMEWRGALDDVLERVIGTGVLRPDDIRFVDYSWIFEQTGYKTPSCAWAGPPTSMSGHGISLVATSNLLPPISRMFEGIFATTGSPRWLISRFPDVKEYFRRDGNRACAVNEILTTAIQSAVNEGRPVVLVTHSMGGLVAFRVLNAHARVWTPNEVPALVTFGSQIALNGLVHMMLGDSTPSPLRPPIVREWINLVGTRDALAYSIDANPQLQQLSKRHLLPGVYDYRVQTNPANAHNPVGYLKNPYTAFAIVHAWCHAFPNPRAAPQTCSHSDSLLASIPSAPDERGTLLDLSMRGGAALWADGYAEYTRPSVWSFFGLRLSSPGVPVPIDIVIHSVGRSNPLIRYGWMADAQLRVFSLDGDSFTMHGLMGFGELHYRRGDAGSINATRDFHPRERGVEFRVSLPYFATQQRNGSYLFVDYLWSHYTSGPTALVSDSRPAGIRLGVDLRVTNVVHRTH